MNSFKCNTRDNRRNISTHTLPSLHKANSWMELSVYNERNREVFIIYIWGEKKNVRFQQYLSQTMSSTGSYVIGVPVEKRSSNDSAGDSSFHAFILLHTYICTYIRTATLSYTCMWHVSLVTSLHITPDKYNM